MQSLISFPFAAGLFWLSVACCAIAQVFIIRSVQGVRVESERGSMVPRSGHLLEVFWAVLPALGLVLLLFFTWKAIGAAHPAQHVASVTWTGSER